MATLGPLPKSQCTLDILGLIPKDRAVPILCHVAGAWDETAKTAQAPPDTSSLPRRLCHMATRGGSRGTADGTAELGNSLQFLRQSPRDSTPRHTPMRNKNLSRTKLAHLCSQQQMCSKQQYTQPEKWKPTALYTTAQEVETDQVSINR